ncbi:hypothetical protein [Methylophaga sp.]|uniref:hypothetical protein n=1 Tax=Methylophaga sp. TaxID=2024840 RepID=UPI003F696EA6
MLKQGILTLLLTMLFAISPAMAADEHKGSEHPAHEMGEAALSDSDKTEQLSDEYKENLREAKDTENMPHPAHKMGAENTHKGSEHPAHEMGDAVTSEEYKKEKDVSEKYKQNLEEAKASEGSKHPAHEMGESEEALDQRGQ